MAVAVMSIGGHGPRRVLVMTRAPRNDRAVPETRWTWVPSRYPRCDSRGPGVRFDTSRWGRRRGTWATSPDVRPCRHLDIATASAPRRHHQSWIATPVSGPFRIGPCFGDRASVGTTVAEDRCHADGI